MYCVRMAIWMHRLAWFVTARAAAYCASGDMGKLAKKMLALYHDTVLFSLLFTFFLE